MYIFLQDGMSIIYVSYLYVGLEYFALHVCCLLMKMVLEKLYVLKSCLGES